MRAAPISAFGTSHPRARVIEASPKGRCWCQDLLPGTPSGKVGQVGTQHRVANSAELLDAVAPVITDAHQNDPLATTTLLVDSASVGTAFRRQLVASGRLGTGVAGLRLLTLSDLVTTLADTSGVASNQLASPMMRDVVVEQLLATQPGAFEAVKDHPSTALRLSQLMAEFEWCRLDESAIARLGSSGAPATATSVIDFIVEARAALQRQAGIKPLGEVASETATTLAADPGLLARAAQPLGTIIVIAQNLATGAHEILDALAAGTSVHTLTVEADSDPVPNQILDVPDPGTEVSLAVRGAAGAIAAGTRPERIAITYSTAQPYLSQLASELDAADITWHGATDVALDSTALARALDAILAMAAGRDDGSSGITRPLLMRWFAIGRIFDGADSLPVDRMRRLVRSEGFFGDSSGWFDRLDVMADYSPQVDDAEALEELDAAEAARERQRMRAAEDARLLLDLLKRLDAAIASLAAADTYTEAATRAWEVLATFHLGKPWWQVDPSERQAHERIRELLSDDIPALDSFTDSAANVVDVAALVSRDLNGRHGWHGHMGTGVYVGALTSITTLQFDRVFLLGAAEGLLPPTAREDSLLPDAARVSLRRSPDDLRISTDWADVLARAFRSAVGAAQVSTVTRPRGALPKGALARPSRHLPPTDGSPAPPAVSSRRASYRLAASGDEADPDAVDLSLPVTPTELAMRGLMADLASIDNGLRRLVQSEESALAPGFDAHFGNLSDWADDDRVWDIGGRGLSASAIEAFLHCPYHFFVKRILGIDTDTIADEVDIIAPSDFGTMLHSALERLFTAAEDEGWLPAAGDPWPAQARDRLTALFDDEVADAKARGLTGWAPSWDATYDMVVATFGQFLTLDAEQTRSGPPMSPVAAELNFGIGDGERVEFTLTSGEVIELRGAIDRLDKSADGKTVGVVDYKSGKADSFTTGLGIVNSNRGTPKERQKVQDLVYDVAARALIDGVEDVKVRFSFVPNRGEPTVVDANHTEDRAALLAEILDRMDAAGRVGHFVPKPQGEKDYCEVCARLRRTAELVQLDHDELAAAQAESDGAAAPDGLADAAEGGAS